MFLAKLLLIWTACIINQTTSSDDGARASQIRMGFGVAFTKIGKLKHDVNTLDTFLTIPYPQPVFTRNDTTELGRDIMIKQCEEAIQDEAADIAMTCMNALPVLISIGTEIDRLEREIVHVMTQEVPAITGFNPLQIPYNLTTFAENAIQERRARLVYDQAKRIVRKHFVDLESYEKDTNSSGDEEVTSIKKLEESDGPPPDFASVDEMMLASEDEWLARGSINMTNTVGRWWYALMRKCEGFNYVLPEEVDTIISTFSEYIRTFRRSAVLTEQQEVASTRVTQIKTAASLPFHVDDSAEAAACRQRRIYQDRFLMGKKTRVRDTVSDEAMKTIEDRIHNMDIKLIEMARAKTLEIRIAQMEKLLSVRKSAQQASSEIFKDILKSNKMELKTYQDSQIHAHPREKRQVIAATVAVTAGAIAITGAIVSTAQLPAIRNHIDALDLAAQAIFAEVVTVHGELFAVASATDEQFLANQKDLNQTRNEIRSLWHDMTKMENHVAKLSAEMLNLHIAFDFSTSVFGFLQPFFNYHASLLQKHLAIQRTMISHLLALADGRLPPGLVEPVPLTKILHQIEKHLKISNPNYKLVFDTPREYYRLPVNAYFEDGKIVIKLPLYFERQAHAPMNVYRVNTVHVPYAGSLRNSSTYTRLEEDMTYLATTRTKTLEMTEQQLNRCIRYDDLYLCTRTEIVSEKSRKTCLGQIFDFGDSKEIKELCNFKIFTDFHPEFTTLETNDEILLANIPQPWTITCTEASGIPSVQHNAVYVIAKKTDLCDCQIYTTDAIIESRLDACPKKQTGIQLEYVINQAVALYNPDRMDVHNTPGDYRLKEPSEIVAKEPLVLTYHEEEHLAVLESWKGTSLKTVMQMVETNGEIWKTKVHRLEKKIHDAKFKLSGWNLIWETWKDTVYLCLFVIIIFIVTIVIIRLGCCTAGIAIKNCKRKRRRYNKKRYQPVRIENDYSKMQPNGDVEMKPVGIQLRDTDGSEPDSNNSHDSIKRRSKFSLWCSSRLGGNTALLSETDIQQWSNDWNQNMNEWFPEELKRVYQAPKWGLDSAGARLVISGLDWVDLERDTRRSREWWSKRPSEELEASIQYYLHKLYMRKKFNCTHPAMSRKTPWAPPPSTWSDRTMFIVNKMYTREEDKQYLTMEFRHATAPKATTQVPTNEDDHEATVLKEIKYLGHIYPRVPLPEVPNAPRPVHRVRPSMRPTTDEDSEPELE